jgi:hypothetical protein
MPKVKEMEENLPKHRIAESRGEYYIVVFEICHVRPWMYLSQVNSKFSQILKSFFSVVFSYVSKRYKNHITIFSFLSILNCTEVQNISCILTYVFRLE